MVFLKGKILRKSKLKKYKLTEKEIFEKFNDLSENEVNTKKNKKLYAKNDVMFTVIKHCRGEKKRWKKNRWI